MKKNTFQGVAYWTVTTSLQDWLAKAVSVISVLEPKKLAVVTYDCLPAGEQLTVQIDDERFPILINNGQGRGVVRVSPTAGCFVVCLIALRKALGDLEVVTDAQVTVPTLPRQSDPLFASDWLRILPIAQELGLIRGEAFVARHVSVLSNVF